MVKTIQGAPGFNFHMTRPRSAFCRLPFLMNYPLIKRFLAKRCCNNTSEKLFIFNVTLFAYISKFWSSRGKKR